MRHRTGIGGQNGKQVVGAGRVVDQERLSSAIADLQISEPVARAFSARTELPTGLGGSTGLSHEDAVTPVLADG